MQKFIDKLKEHIIAIKDFPKPGIIFRDVTPLFQDPKLVNEVIDKFAEYVSKLDVDAIVGVESRGFLFGLPLALKLNKPFVLVRKPNKLPRPTYKQEFDLEYGSTTIELQKGDIKPNWKVCIVDDLLASGGTIAAAKKLVNESQAEVVSAIFLIELVDLKARAKLDLDIFTLLKY